MTEEEKKAIYSFNEWIEISEKGRLDYFQIIDKDIEDMRTVLNLIQKLQKEKEIHIKLEQQYKKEYLDAKENYKRMLAEIHAQSLNNSIAEKKKHEEQLEALNEGWKIELEKKDKIIDLMAEKIASDNRSINEEYAVDEKMMDTKYIKQYFEKKGDGDEFCM